jgi:hypothetical protein
MALAFLLVAELGFRRLLPLTAACHHTLPTRVLRIVCGR